MSREPFDQALVGEFERDLRDALAIEPSPDFARQVRERIAARPPSRSSWTAGLAAAAACVAAVGLGMWIRSADVRPGPPQNARHHDVHLNAEVRLKATVAPVERPSETSRTTRVELRPEPGRIPEPEVIVPPDRALALARLLQLAREGAVDEETLQPVASAASPATLEIKPLIVAPIPVPEVETPAAATQGGADRE